MSRKEQTSLSLKLPGGYSVQQLMRRICCLNAYEHIAYEPVSIVCGGNACLSCVRDYSKNQIKCRVCEKIHVNLDQDVMNLNEKLKHRYNDELNEITNLTFEQLSNIEQKFKDVIVNSDIKNLIDLAILEIDEKFDATIKQLNLHREKLKSELQEFKNENQSDVFKSLRKNLNELTNAKIQQDFDSFILHHKILKDCQKKLSDYKTQIEKIKFVKSENRLNYEPFVGKLQVPSLENITDTESINKSINDLLKTRRPVTSRSRASSRKSTRTTENDMKKEKSIKNIKHSRTIEVNNADKLGRIACVEGGLLVTDYPNHELKYLKFSNDQIRSINSEYIEKPWCIDVSLNDEIIISDLVDDKICIFDFQMKLKRKFKTKLRSSIVSIDDTSKDKKYIYASHWLGNKITIYDSSTGNEMDFSLTIDSPMYMTFTKKYMYVVSQTDFESDPSTNKVLKIKKGSNCIYKIIKNEEFEVVNVISFVNWLSPIGIYLDSENGNLYTLAYELNENNIVSTNRSLFVIDRYGAIIGMTPLIGVGNCNSVKIDDKIIAVSNDSLIRIFEFQN